MGTYVSVIDRRELFRKKLSRLQNFLRGNKNIYLHFMSFRRIDMTRVVEILPQIRQELTYFTESVSWALMSLIATQEAGASATMIFTMLNRINAVPTRLGLKSKR